MNRRLSVVLPTITATITCFVATTASADCYMPALNTPAGYCDGCRYEGTMDLHKNETCERVLGIPKGNYTVDAEYLSSRIVERAKHGIAGANGTTIAYQPAKDYVGADDFVMEMSFRQNGKAGKFTVHYAAMVR